MNHTEMMHKSHTDLLHKMSLENYPMSTGLAHSVLLHSSQLLRERGSPPQYSSLQSDMHVRSSHLQESNTHDAPLNLSMTSSSSSAFTSPISRPSVITCATLPHNGNKPTSYSRSSPPPQTYGRTSPQQNQWSTCPPSRHRQLHNESELYSISTIPIQMY